MKVEKKRYQNTPFYINGKKAKFRYVSEAEPLDLILICTKYAGLQAALDQIKPFVHENTIVLSCLNGISSEEICQKVYPNNPVIRCIVQGMDSTYFDNTVDFAHVGEILFGSECKEQENTVKELESFFASYQIPYRVCEDIVREQWNKLMLNCGINQVCAAYQGGYGICQDGGRHQEEFIQAMKEVQAVARAKHIALTQEDINAWVQLVNSLRPEGMPSMAQDIKAHRKTELALFSGTIVPMGKELGISTPVLSDLMNKIQTLECDF
ncbi:MAG: 2-dehydropantoate 2-reductase [Faecalicoccus sp.]|uniref:ketopantoate reductase family protein n=1 Tax=unclassified Faecalicoccus TaxID=2643311 RepID=UPI0025DEC55C|nr:2-dehydropantoate 2-reductase [Faecalicoccus sp.]MCI6378853.1 2-dehydropantoate 2-reductase [Erysipelotrichaceae bacterium]MDY4869146.1 2-dehydropantoate 2-reductase [Faecalicoccus sp.]